MVEHLDALSPLRVLGRGYALARLQPEGTPLRDSTQVKVGDQISLQLHQGQLSARVCQVVDEKKTKET
jgi:exodeoxyribonuclease VII large subunit